MGKIQQKKTIICGMIILFLNNLNFENKQQQQSWRLLQCGAYSEISKCYCTITRPITRIISKVIKIASKNVMKVRTNLD